MSSGGLFSLCYPACYCRIPEFSAIVNIWETDTNRWKHGNDAVASGREARFLVSDV